MMPLLVGLVPILTEVLDRVIPDPQAKQKALSEILDGAKSIDMGQLDVNKAEAGSSSIFVAGWRPMIGWVCAFALAYQYIFLKLGIFIAGLFNEALATKLLNAPQMDGLMWELLFGLLGMAGLRTFEKFKGVAR